MVEYIKKETVESVFRNARKRMKPGDYSGQEFYIRDNILLNAEQIIHLIPAADVVPVRHGRWELEENWETGYGVYVHVCSVCNAITPVNVSRYKYCPNCGAKMDGEA